MVVKEAVKEVRFVNEVGRVGNGNEGVPSTCREGCERSAKEVDGLSLYRRERYLLLSLLSHTSPLAPVYARIRDPLRIGERSLLAPNRVILALSRRYYHARPFSLGARKPERRQESLFAVSVSAPRCARFAKPTRNASAAGTRAVGATGRARAAIQASGAEVTL